MGIIKVRGLVLREANSKEADKIITVYTKEKGKLTISAKSARKPNSPFLAGTQMFSYCDFVIYNNREIATLSQIELIEPFQNIRSDLVKLSYGAYFMEMLEYVVVEGVVSQDILKLTLKILQKLNKQEESYDNRLLAIIFELRMLMFLGYMPETTVCSECGAEHDGTIYFSAEAGGVICSSCRKKYAVSYKLSAVGLYTIQYILSADLVELFRFSLSDEVINEISRIVKDYLFVHIDHKFKMLDFLEKLK